MEAGMSEMRDLYENSTDIQFQVLSDSYDIPPAHFLKYNAVSAAIGEYWTCGQLEPPTVTVFHAILSQGTDRRTITMLYAIYSYPPTQHP